jgi:hypothetical protein
MIEKEESSTAGRHNSKVSRLSSVPVEIDSQNGKIKNLANGAGCL